jgi:cytochrome c556
MRDVGAPARRDPSGAKRGSQRGSRVGVLDRPHENKEAVMRGWVACVFIVATASLAAQAPMAKMAISSEEDYSKAMKEVQMRNGALRKSIASSNEADAAAAAARLETIFKDVQAYWEDKKVADAAGYAKNAVAAVQAVSKAVAAHDMAAAGAANTTLGAQCMSCHTAHREKTPDGGFKMK